MASVIGKKCIIAKQGIFFVICFHKVFDVENISVLGKQDSQFKTVRANLRPGIFIP